MADKKITRQLSIFINGKEVKNSLGAIGREIGKVKGKLREANDPEDIIRYKKELENLRKKYGDVKAEIDDTNNVLDEARGHFDNLLSGFLSGNISQATAGLKGIATNIKGITKAAWAFIATPIGAAITALTAVLGAGKMWFDYNVELSKTLKLTEQLTELQGEELSNYRAQVSGVAKAFNQEYNEVLKAAVSLSKQMGISFDKSLSLIEEGFVRGANVNGDFLEKVREYPIQFKNAGYSAQEFIDLATQEAKGGVFSDKLLDAIKEANLSLKEMTKTQKEALENAFGKKFSDEIEKGLKSGSLNTKQAIEGIINQAEKLGLNFQQKQQLIADVFKGAGEDAGGFDEIVKQLNESFSEQNKQLSENELATLKLSEATKSVEEELAKMFDASQSGFPAMLTNLKAFGKEIFANTLRGLRRMFTSIEQLKGQAGLKGQAEAVKRVSENMKLFNSESKEEAKAQIQAALKNIDRLEERVKNASITDKLFGRKTIYEEKLAEAKSYYAELQKIATGTSTEFNEYQETQTPIEKETQEPTETNKTKDDKLEKHKEFLRKKRELFEKSEQELDDLIKKIQDERLLNAKEGVEKELLEIDQKYEQLKEKFVLSEEDKQNLTLEQITAREDAIRELEDEKAREKHELKKERDAEFKEELAEIEAENKLLEEEAKFEQELNEARSAEERQLILLQKAKYVADQELKIAKEKELAKVKEYENAEQLKAAIRKKYKLKSEKVETDFNTAEKELKSDQVKWTELTEAQKLNTIKGALNNASDAFNKGSGAWKAIKIAETTITTYQSAVNAYNSLSGIPIVGPALGAVAAGLAIATGIAQVSKIASTPMKQMPKHYYGGPTGDKAVYHDEFGAVTGVVHDNEWVAPKFMTESPKYAPTISWLEKERKANLGKGYFDGGHTSTPSPIYDDATETTTEDDTTNVNALLLEQLTRFNNHLDSGIKANALIGDDNIEAFNQRNEKINNSRENAKIQ